MAKIKWKKIKNYENYEISNTGLVRSIKPGGNIILKPQEGKYGHRRVGLWKNATCRRFLVHRLVADHFLKHIKRKPIIHHIDGNPRNNMVSNLEWSTYSLNAIEGFKNGRKRLIGENNPSSKLSNSIVKKLRKDFATGRYTYQDIANKFQTNKITVFDAINRRTWRHIK